MCWGKCFSCMGMLIFCSFFAMGCGICIIFLALYCKSVGYPLDDNYPYSQIYMEYPYDYRVDWLIIGFLMFFTGMVGMFAIFMDSLGVKVAHIIMLTALILVLIISLIVLYHKIEYMSPLFLEPVLNKDVELDGQCCMYGQRAAWVVIAFLWIFIVFMFIWLFCACIKYFLHRIPLKVDCKYCSGYSSRYY